MIYDLTITLDENTLPFSHFGDPHMTWKHLADHSTHKNQVSLFSMVTHLGTHIDTPLHFIKNGKTTAEIDLERYCGEAVVLELPVKSTEEKLVIDDILEKNARLIKPGDILILYTGWEDRLGKAEYFDSPDFDPSLGETLQRFGIKGIGTDLPSIDLYGEAHVTVLSRDIGVIESLINLKPLVGKRCYFSAVPLKFADGDGSPVRAYAVV